ncbi:MAG TPA: phage tail protein [Haliangium sp.]|nr:phage tail protein [Haliangium sp.]
MSTNRTAYTSGHFLFRLDGSPDTSWLKSVDGGGVKGSVTEENVGPDNFQLKHVATVEIEPLAIEVGMSASSPVFKWIQDSWKRQFSRRNGEVVHADFNLTSVLAQSFEDALISEVTFPTLDGSNKEAAYLAVKLLPERIKLEKRSGEKIKGVETEKQKLWTPSSFRLDIDGVDCRQVNKIESFTVKQKIKPLYTGKNRYPELEPTGVEFPKLNLSLAAAHADGFIEWYNKLVVEGDQDPRQQKTGSIDFLDPTTNEEIFSVQLNKIGINHLTIEKSEANAESIKRCKIELFVESMELDLSAGGLG